jgi:hypothetical protein
MRRNNLCTLLIVVACLAVASCQRLDSGLCPKEAAARALAARPSPRPAALADAIPSDYGTPIGVTQDPSQPQRVAVWFARPDKSVVAVFVDVQKGTLAEGTFTIPRR